MNKRVLIGGGTGFVGGALKTHLSQKGYQVTLISRTAGPGRLTWNEVNNNGIPDVDAVVQLAGANIIDKSWSSERKKEIFSSRVETTSLLVKAMEKSKSPPKVYICTSAVGIYPNSQTEQFDEFSNKVADNVAGQLTTAVENASVLPPSLQTSTRRVVMRWGVILGAGGGALKSMNLPFRLGLGGPIGSGNQFMPWIHLSDAVGLQAHAIDSNVSGVFNGVAPEIVTNEQFTKTLGRVLNRPAVMRLPEFAVKLIFGERAFLLLEGSKVIPKRTLESGYKFMFPNLEPALRDIFKK